MSSPAWCVRTEPLTLLSPLPPVRWRSRDHSHSWEPPRSSQARPRERCEPRDDPECLPSVEDLRPATPSRAPGSGLRRPRGLATAVPVVDAFSPARRPLGLRASQDRVHAPRCLRESRFFEPRRRSPTSATQTTRGHTRRAFDPRTRVGLSPRCSPAPTDAGCVGPTARRRAGDLRATTCSRRLARVALHSRGRGRSRAGALERRRAARARKSRACPPRDAPGTRVTDLDASRGLENRVTDRASLDPPRMHAPRRATPLGGSGCLPPRRNPYASGGLLLRARPDRSPFTPSPQRHCSGARAPLRLLAWRLPLTRKAPEAARPVEPVGPKSPRNGGPQRPSRLLRPNQLAGRCAANFMTLMSYESSVRATEKEPKTMLFSPLRSPQRCPQVVPACAAFPQHFQGFAGGLGMGMGRSQSDVVALIVANDGSDNQS